MPVPSGSEKLGSTSVTIPPLATLISFELGEAVDGSTNFKSASKIPGLVDDSVKVRVKGFLTPVSSLDTTDNCICSTAPGSLLYFPLVSSTVIFTDSFTAANFLSTVNVPVAVAA
ncbi:hypothetical protein D3C73_695450 [compost metagenome]